MSLHGSQCLFWTAEECKAARALKPEGVRINVYIREGTIWQCGVARRVGEAFRIAKAARPDLAYRVVVRWKAAAS